MWRQDTPITLSLTMCLLNVHGFNTPHNNLLGNPSFESPSLDPWILSERSSMWTFVDGTPDTAGVQPGPAHHGTHSLGLGPYQGQAGHKALVCSQYVSLDQLSGSHTVSLGLSFWIYGRFEDVNKLFVIVQVITDNPHTYRMNITSNDHSTEKIFKKIRGSVLFEGVTHGVALFFVVEDDVDLRIVPVLWPTCSIETGSCFSKKSVLYEDYTSSGPDIPLTLDHIPSDIYVGVFSAHVQLSTRSDSLTCKKTVLEEKELFSTETTIRTRHSIQPGRLDILTRELFQRFGTYNYIEVPTKSLIPLMKSMLPLMHANSASAISVSSREFVMTNESNFWFTYKFGTYMCHGLTTVLDIHQTPATIVVRVQNIRGDVVAFIVDVLSTCRHSDVVVLDQHLKDLTTLQSTICRLNMKWMVYDTAGFLVLKRETFTETPTLNLPAMTNLHELKTAPVCPKGATTTDVILMTKNRPLQALAFLESLSLNVANINMVWVLMRSDAKLISEGYEVVFECFKKSNPWIAITILSDKRGEFGKQFMSILMSMQARYVVLCVDEIIWMNPVDLAYASCLLNSDSKISTFQLRLGHNYKRPKRVVLNENRVFPLEFDEEIDIYYPRYLGDDFGYVPNLDGTLMRTSDVLADLRDIARDSAQPLSLETRWVWSRVHVHSRRWQLMFTRSRLVNNMVLADGQVVMTTVVSNASLDLANLILSNRTKIDVEHFMVTYGDKVQGAHAKYPVTYIDLTC